MLHKLAPRHRPRPLAWTPVVLQAQPVAVAIFVLAVRADLASRHGDDAAAGHDAAEPLMGRMSAIAAMARASRQRSRIGRSPGHQVSSAFVTRTSIVPLEAIP